MYEQKYNFNSRPFTPLPFVPNYFPTNSIQQSLEQTKLCIERASGPVVIVGEQGTGKSLLLQMLRDEFASQFRVVLLDCARMAEREDLFQNILFELGQNYRSMSEGELRLAVMDFLRPSEQCPHGMLLLVDEAESLPLSLLDEVRRITNLVRDGQPRVRLVLAGTARFEENLAEWNLGSFVNRIAARCYLRPLSRPETREYVVAHINRVGGNTKLFSEDSLKEIHRCSDGYPRVVNQLCEQMLLLGALQDTEQFDTSFVQTAWDSLQNIPGAPSVASARPLSDVVETIRPSVPAVESSSDEGWDVIEFGELSDDATPARQTGPETEDWKPVDFGTISSTNSDSSEGSVSHGSPGSHEGAESPESFESPDELIRRATNDVDPYPLLETAETSVAGKSPEERKSEADVVSSLAEQLSGEAESENTESETEFQKDSLTAPWHGNNESHTESILTNGEPAELVADPVEAVEGSTCVIEDEFCGELKSDKEGQNDATDRSHLVSEFVASPTESDAELRPTFDNPFAEEFMSVEMVIDRFMPVFIEQNISSLSVTKSELELINPEPSSPIVEPSEDLPVFPVPVSGVDEECLEEVGKESHEVFPGIDARHQDSHPADNDNRPFQDISESIPLPPEPTVIGSDDSVSTWDLAGPTDDELRALEQHGVVVESTFQTPRQPQQTVRESAETISQSDLKETLEGLSEAADIENVADLFSGRVEQIGNPSPTGNNDDEEIMAPIGLGESSSIQSSADSQREAENKSPIDQQFIERRATEILSSLDDLSPPSTSNFPASASTSEASESSPLQTQEALQLQNQNDEVASQLNQLFAKSEETDATSTVVSESVESLREPTITHLDLGEDDEDDEDEGDFMITQIESPQDLSESDLNLPPTDASPNVEGLQSNEEPIASEPAKKLGDWKSQLQDAFTGSPEFQNHSDENEILSSAPFEKDSLTAESLTAEAFAEKQKLGSDALNTEAADLANQLNSVFGNESESLVEETPQQNLGLETQLDALLQPAQDEGAIERTEEQIFSELRNLAGETPASIPIEYPLAESNGNQMPVDDRDMLIVTRAEEKPAHDQDKVPDPVEQQPPSTGTAKRMDYQQLFDQLRNATEESSEQ